MAYTVDYLARGVVFGEALWRRVFETQAVDSSLALGRECDVTLIRAVNLLIIEKDYKLANNLEKKCKRNPNSLLY